MSDYIKREDAIRQIVKTSAQNELDIHAIGTVIYILSEMDSADVVEVVRCQDCKHFDTGYCGIPFIGKKVNLNHYCSYGERKEELVDEDDIQPHVCSTCHWCLNDWHQEPCNICAPGSTWQDGR